MQKPPLFFANYNASERVIINQGGTSSGKTYTLVDLLFVHAMSEPRQIITVAGQDIPNLKSGAYRDAKTIYGSSEVYRQWFAKPNETNRQFTCINGSIIEFKSYNDEQDARSGKRDYLFINEANGIPYNIAWQLMIRTRKKVYLDYNPTARFWAHEQLIGKPGVRLIISDHRHNPFLTDEEHHRIESIQDPELFNVYARGKTGQIEGLVYHNWQLCDHLPVHSKKRWIGIDFGFTNDPTAIIDLHLSEGQLWIHEICYRRGMLNSHIYDLICEHGLTHIPIVADSAEPKSIAELRSRGLLIEPARKGPDSVKNGIDILKRYRLNITRSSTNLQKELLSYQWKKNRQTGLPTNEPVDAHNHALDAIRYVALNHLNNKPELRGIRRISF